MTPSPLFWQPRRRVWARIDGPPGRALLYGRPAREAETHNLPSQDAVGLFSDASGWTVVVCDGVSQSFYGDFAAWVLTEALVPWLHQADPNALPSPEEWLAWGKALAQKVQARYRTLPLLPEGPSLLRKVMEEKRALGSETMFAALRVWLPSPALPLGRVWVVYGGNIRLRLWHVHHGEKRLPLADPVRWSTRGGFNQPPYVWQSSLEQDGWQAAVFYTDGLESLDALFFPWDLETLLERAETSWKGPLSDDQSYLEVWWVPTDRGEAVSPLEGAADLTVREARLQRFQQSWKLVWQAPPNALYFRMETGAETVTVPASEWVLPEGVAQVRVQAVDATGRQGPWTPWLRVPQKVAPLESSVSFPSWLETLVLLGVGVGLAFYLFLLLLKGYGLWGT